MAVRVHLVEAAVAATVLLLPLAGLYRVAALAFVRPLHAELL